MRFDLRKFFRRRVFVLMLAFGAILLLAGGSYALSAHTSKTASGPEVEASESPEAVESGSPEPAETNAPDNSENHGGTIERFHDASACNLTDVSKLSGNWTHGDYVSAVAAADPTKVQDAAHSDCGKPVHTGKANAKTKAAHTKSATHGKSAASHGSDGPEPAETEAPEAA